MPRTGKGPVSKTGGAQAPCGFESHPLRQLGNEVIGSPVDDVVTRSQKRGAELVGEVVQYEDMYRLCYLRGPEGIIVALAEQLDDKSVTDVLENPK